MPHRPLWLAVTLSAPWASPTWAAAVLVPSKGPTSAQVLSRLECVSSESGPEEGHSVGGGLPRSFPLGCPGPYGYTSLSQEPKLSFLPAHGLPPPAPGTLQKFVPGQNRVRLTRSSAEFWSRKNLCYFHQGGTNNTMITSVTTTVLIMAQIVSAPCEHVPLYRSRWFHFTLQPKWVPPDQSSERPAVSTCQCHALRAVGSPGEVRVPAGCQDWAPWPTPGELSPSWSAVPLDTFSVPPAHSAASA